MGITIITDSGSDIKQETAAKWGIRVLPLMVRFGEEEFLDDVTLTADQMYERMIRTGELPRTGQVPPYRGDEEGARRDPRRGQISPLTFQPFSFLKRSSRAASSVFICPSVPIVMRSQSPVIGPGK